MPALDTLRARTALAILGNRSLRPAAWNQFFEGANISRNRSYQPVRAQDADKTQYPYIRTALLSHARRLAANVGFVRGVVRDCQMFSLGPLGLRPKSLSTNNTWAESADAYFEQWCKVCDVTGRFSFRDLQFLSLACVLIDGDHGVILTETDTGFPKLQFIEGHQIGNHGGPLGTATPSADDTDLVDGVRLDRLGRPSKYRVVTGTDSDVVTWIDAPAFVHVYEPDRATGHRGISAFGPVMNHLRDIEDWLSYSKSQAKWDSSLIGWRTTIHGTKGQTAWDEDAAADNSRTDYTLEQMIGGHLPSVKPGERYDFHNTNRPSQQAMSLIDYLESDVLQCLGLPANWKNLHKEGGATLRAALIRAQYRFLILQGLLADRFCTRVRNWVVAKGAKRGDLPPIPNDWWRHIWKGPAHLTADIAKVNKENREDLKFGVRTLEQDASEAGDDWIEIRDQTEKEVNDLLTRAKKLAAAHNIDLKMALELLSQRSPNPQTLAAPAPEPEPATEKDE